jgi:hypothetical protein
VTLDLTSEREEIKGKGGFKGIRILQLKKLRKNSMEKILSRN